MFKNVLLNGAAVTTRVLVTHALHFLPQVDYIYTMIDGRIAEWGTHAELMANDGAFAKFINEFVTKDEGNEKQGEGVDEEEEEDDEDEQKKRRGAVKGAQLMQQEERSTGAVSWEVYKAYAKAGNGAILLPLLGVSLVLMQAATVLSSYWSVYPGFSDFSLHLLTGRLIQARVVAG